jgi:hypothetical protein
MAATRLSRDRAADRMIDGLPTDEECRSCPSATRVDGTHRK